MGEISFLVIDLDSKLVLDPRKVGRVKLKEFLDSTRTMRQAFRCESIIFVMLGVISNIATTSCSGPTTVLACSLMFIGLVVVLHILGKFRS